MWIWGEEKVIHCSVQGYALVTHLWITHLGFADKRAPRELHSWRVQGTRQPCANPSPTFRQPFANLFSQPLCKPLFPRTPGAGLETRANDFLAAVLTRRKCLFSWVRRRTHQLFGSVNQPVRLGSTGPLPKQIVYVDVPFLFPTKIENFNLHGRSW